MLVQSLAMSVFFPLLLHGQKQASDIYKESSPAVLSVEGEHKSGSGFLISADGVVVTNYHVVAGEKNISVRLASGLELAIDEVIAEDSQLDIVLLRVKAKGFPKLTLGDSDRVLPGDPITVISNPLGLTGSVSDGLVSGVREFDGAKMLQISAPISPGSSGGPVLDRAGRVIGVARATILGGQNLNLAVPANAVAALAANPKRLSDDSHASPSRSVPNLQMQKIARYIDAHLYPEARDQLGALVQDSEFDPGLRFTLGEVLFRMQDYVQAARDFEVARQLDKGFWQAAEREADAQLHIWETTRNLEARLAASRLYDDLSKVQDESPSVSALYAASLLGVANDLEDGRLRASRQLGLLMSPVGIWPSDHERFKVTLSGARWWLSSDDQTKYPWHVSFDAVPSPKMTGSGYAEDPNCMTMVSVEASLFDFATRMEVDGFPTGEIALSSAYQGRSAADQRFMYRACREIVVHLKGALKGERMYHINLRRVQ
jgi:tetratricopeptide (TPR) repeat protein